MPPEQYPARTIPEAEAETGALPAEALPVGQADNQRRRSGARGPELVIGLVGPLGVPMDQLEHVIQIALEQVGYVSHPIHLIGLAAALQEAPAIDDTHYQNSATSKMDLGNWARKKWGRGDALARVALMAIRNTRQAITGDSTTPAERHAYILHQLKHPDEVQTLRGVYGKRLIVVGGFAAPIYRQDAIAKKIARSRHSVVNARDKADALLLLDRDEFEVTVDSTIGRLGQNVRDTFPLADAFVDTTSPDALQAALKRLIELIFNFIVHTPTRDEQGMFFAKAAAVRSSSLARQVGAAIANDDGDLLVVGTNEAPKAGGGLYWPDDTPDERTFRSGHDPSDEFRRNVVLNALQALRRRGWLKAEISDLADADLSARAFDGDQTSLLRETRVGDIVEFGREVHAEMAAISEAARRGVQLLGGTLYVTTYPCHECARHIIAAGLRRVVFIEPYAKSLASQLYADAISGPGGDLVEKRVVVDAYVGVAPRRYMEWFEMSEERKERNGTVKPWRPLMSQPRIEGWSTVYIDAEGPLILQFEQKMMAAP